MISARKLKAKSRKYREMDILSEYGNMDIMLGEGNTNYIERELDGIIEGPGGHPDTQSLPNRKNSSQRMRSEILIPEMGQLDKRDFQSLSTCCLTK